MFQSGETFKGHLSWGDFIEVLRDKRTLTKELRSLQRKDHLGDSLIETRELMASDTGREASNPRREAAMKEIDSSVGDIRFLREASIILEPLKEPTPGEHPNLITTPNLKPNLKPNLNLT